MKRVVKGGDIRNGRLIAVLFCFVLKACLLNYIQLYILHRYFGNQEMGQQAAQYATGVLYHTLRGFVKHVYLFLL